MKSKIFGIDFDGTIVKNKYPDLGEPIDGAIETIEELITKGHKIILYTMRNAERLAQAVEFLEDEGIELWGVNENPTQKYWAKDSRKIYCDIVIDDCSLGCPLDEESLTLAKPYVDWEAIRDLLVEKGVLV